MTEPSAETQLSSLFAALGGEPAEVVFSAGGGLLPSAYPVSAFAAASIGLAVSSAADVLALRSGRRRVRAFVDRAHADVAFRSERYVEAVGWTLPPVWDPIAGDYETADGFVRLHTNYRSHRDAVLRVLRVPESREAVRGAVRTLRATELEDAVVAAGGAAAAMRTAEEFAESPAGRAVFAEPLFAWTRSEAPPLLLTEDGGAPLAGVRVLDLTRVIAGPVCTRFLSAFGASVLRIDPPGFEEVPALLSETTAGKRRAALDLRAPGDRERFLALVADAHLLVSGYRSDALTRLGFDAAALRRRNPGLVTVSLDAYGWTGPWATRRGFDSLVQMSAGIAAHGRAVTNASGPFPLPAQALDHGTGYLAAAAACRALAVRLAEGRTSDVRLSLARTARFLMEQGDGGDPRGRDATAADVAPYLEGAETPWGAARRVRCPGALEGFVPGWTIPPGPLGVDAAQF